MGESESYAAGGYEEGHYPHHHYNPFIDFHIFASFFGEPTMMGGSCRGYNINAFHDPFGHPGWGQDPFAVDPFAHDPFSAEEHATACGYATERTTAAIQQQQ
ncbi:hypothetical protein BCR43DRAFT_517835 [Syncephalastrum racemosum]|uniref:Uncharacterized protein n=1 Tax=Syncephalastrum racemosum TaxID=13706 RepID=A0A1X2H5F9_SYNRA|nr:hypothetical protein BCR43DRAFT_517835 [Syncephalastrum racemosum]